MHTVSEILSEKCGAVIEIAGDATVFEAVKAMVEANVGAPLVTDDIRWIRSYVHADGDGLGTVHIYEASSPDVIREHAQRADLPVTEIVPIASTVVVRPDPVATAP